jgi:RNA polymerase sigma factor (sigma-70 family)
MAIRQASGLLGHLRQLFGRRAAAAVSDAELLERFRTTRDEAAFELLVRRHAPLVYGVCRRTLRHAQDAEDAFQATFLALVRRAGTIESGASLASWLYKVALRSALRVRDRSARRAGVERPLADLEVAGDGPDPVAESAWRELRPVLDAEVQRLPEKYRAAFVLCCLQGKTNEEAAAELGCPKGTVLSRLSRARERLRDRLACRGLLDAAEAVTTTLADKAAPLASVAPVLINATIQAGLLLALKDLVAAGDLAAGTEAASSTGGRFLRPRTAYAVAVVTVLLGVGTGVAVSFHRQAQPVSSPLHRVQAPKAGPATASPFGLKTPGECSPPTLTLLPPPTAAGRQPIAK